MNTLSEKGLERIAKMQNLTQNELDQITRMQNVSQDELEKIARMRRIKNYENISKEGLLIALLKSEQSRAELYNKVEEIKAEENRIEKTEKYPDRYDPDYNGIRDINNLFDEINVDYYKPVITKSNFKGNHIEYESSGDKDKNVSPLEHLNMIRPYLRDK